MEENVNLIRKFYDAFSKGDADTMLSCYHMDVKFKDPAFGKLNSEDTRYIWKMLLSRGSNLEISYNGEWADEKSGGVNWEAKYEFGPNKRKVHNKIRARFYFDEGQIIEHTDVFDFWKWSSMALGLPGLLMGWSPFIKNKVRKTIKKRLLDYKSKD